MWQVLAVYLEVDRYPLLASARQIRKQMNLRSLWIIASAGSSAVNALQLYCTASPLEALSDARR
jgi:hypothetical protein